MAYVPLFLHPLALMKHRVLLAASMRQRHQQLPTVLSCNLEAALAQADQEVVRHFSQRLDLDLSAGEQQQQQPQQLPHKQKQILWRHNQPIEQQVLASNGQQGHHGTRVSSIAEGAVVQAASGAGVSSTGTAAAGPATTAADGSSNNGPGRDDLESGRIVSPFASSVART